MSRALDQDDEADVERTSFLSTLLAWQMGQMDSFVAALSRQIQLGAAEQAALVMECFRGSSSTVDGCLVGAETSVVSPYNNGVVGPFSFVATCTISRIQYRNYENSYTFCYFLFLKFRFRCCFP
jgi:hypothetical protein